MLEQLAKQLRKHSSKPTPIYSRMTLSLVVFSIFMSYFLYQQVMLSASVLAYANPATSTQGAAVISQPISPSHE